LSDDKEVRIRQIVLPLATAFLCLAQGDWKSISNLPGIDWQGLTGAKKDGALKVMQAEGCTCGCDMKIAECRIKDHACGTSRKLANTVVKATLAGKNAAAIRADLKRVASEPEPVLDEPVKISLANAPSRGPETAKITIVEFSDFQCPYCSKAVLEANQVLRAFPKDVRLVFKQFPLDQHSDAQFAAEAALAAQAQGKFWEMHDLMYAGFPNLARPTILGYAKKLNLDMKRFTAEVDSHKYKARVLAEEQEGEEAGVSGTPTFFLNGKKYNEVFTAAKFGPLVQQELKK
jgi:protein-disulfide isomerase